MDCPVCKYPNAKGATHCGMCYEVFNRSAAQSYMHAVKRERRESEGIPEEPNSVIKPKDFFSEGKALLEKMDWRLIADHATSLWKKSKLPLLIGIVLIVLWMVASFIFSASLWYHLLGKKFVYAFPARTATQYLVGMNQNVKSWSERQGRLDTPMEESKRNEMASLLLEQKTPAVKNQRLVQVDTKEWIQILNDAAGFSSHSLPKNHPSLSSARLLFDKKGALLERRYALSPRVAKSLPFLAPRFPKRSLRRGQTWNETIEWLDVYDDWRLYWTGAVHWTVGDMEPCGNNSCVRLTYQVDLQPQLRGGPSWLPQGKAAIGTDGRVSTEGAALYDADQKLILSNTFSYDGLLRIPIADLGRIPWELRIGRLVKGQAGDIVIRFDNKIDIRKN